MTAIAGAPPPSGPSPADSAPRARLVMTSPIPSLIQRKIEALGWQCIMVKDQADAAVQLAAADGCFGKLDATLLVAAPRLRWLQANSVALDNFWFSELRTSSVIVTNLRGIYSDFIADHAMGFILSFARGLHHYGRRQAVARWDPTAPILHLSGATLLIVGLGSIGAEIARRAQPFGLRVVAVDPHAAPHPGVAEIYPPNQLYQTLSQADFIVLTVPHTAQTEFMIDTQAFLAMKRSAVLINVGRGKVVRIDALFTALQRGTIAGAALDVFEHEPLRPEHPLWAMENVIITPHCAYQSTTLEQRKYDLVVENARRFLNRESLLNVVDKELGYVVATHDGIGCGAATERAPFAS